MLVSSLHATARLTLGTSSSLILPRSRSVTSRRNREFSSSSSAIWSPAPHVRSGSLATTRRARRSRDRPGRSGGGLNSGMRIRVALFVSGGRLGQCCRHAVVSLVPGDARPDTGLPGQIDHIIAYCGTAGLLGLGYPAAKLRFGMIVMLVSLAATLEVAQRWIPGRHPQFIDFAASVAGTCLGMLAAMVVHRIALADLR